MASVLDDMASRPVRPYCSDASMLDPATPIIVDCDPRAYLMLSRQWHDQDTARGLDEALHRLELERAARPPVIEVTVTSPPEGISRAEVRRRARLAFSGRRLRDYLLRESDPVPAGPVTDEFPAVRPGDLPGTAPHVMEVRVQ